MRKLRLLQTFVIGLFFLACLPDDSLKHRNDAVPEQLDDNWEVDSPQNQGIDPEGLDAAYEMLHAPDEFNNALALLVARNNRLVFETYTRQLSDRDRLHHVQSTTKSITSLVLGILGGKGYFPDLDATMESHWPEAFVSHPDKVDITLEHLLTMRSGIAFDNDSFSVEMYIDGPSNPVEYILDKSMYASPGEEFYYRDTDPHLMSALTTHLTGKTLERWAQEDLFSPLGIDEHYWGSDEGGNSMGAHGLFLKPRDLLRIGQLILDEGRHEDAQIVPAVWIETAATIHAIPTDIDFPYGYYFWIVPELDAFTTWGHGGNFIFIAPQSNAVILLVSLPDTNDETVGTLLPDFLPMAEVILDACN